MPLTDTELKATRAKPKTQRLFDGGGLYLEVLPSGGRYWRMKYRFDSREKRLALGTYPETTLRRARERRDEARQLLAEGLDPGAERKAAKAREQQARERAFSNVAQAWLKHNAARWKPHTLAAVRKSLEADAFPMLGELPIEAISARQVMAAVRKIEDRGAGETAGRVLQRVRAVFRFAVQEGWLTTNPTLDVVPRETLKPRQPRHRAAMPEAELPGFLAKLDSYEGDRITALALRLLLLTAVRPGELRGARWGEFDMGACRWRLPAARMKMGTEHLVPLSRQAIAVLREAQDLSGHAEGTEADPAALVFPSPFYPGKSLSENTFNSALARMGFKGIATAHGMRALFSTVANECGQDPDVIERHLAHAERNEVRAAYHRSTYLKARAELMQWWADFVDGKRAAVVVPLLVSGRNGKR
jgi:integrase